METKTKPSDFNCYPWSSVLQNCECEQIAQNIMVILEQTGNTFRPLDWAEYSEVRIQDGGFNETKELECFNKVIGYCKSADTAVLFSKSWKE